MNIDMNILRKGLITTAVISVVALGGLSSAVEEKNLTTDEFCEKYFNDSSYIMELRQGNVETKEVSYQLALSNGFSGNERKTDVVKHLVNESFKYPSYNSYQSQQKAISDFDGHSLCVSFDEK